MLPSGTVTVAGTLARAVLLASETDSPPVGAAAVNVIVPWTGSPPADTFVESRRPCSAGTVTTLTTSVAAWLALEYVAVMVTVAAVAVVLITNVWLVLPAATVTFTGTVAAGLLLVSVTTAPVVGAAAERLTVPVTVVPASTELDESTTLDNAATVVVVAAVGSVQPETATHARNNNPTPERAVKERTQLKLTSTHRR
jgi:hypothetical protein